MNGVRPAIPPPAARTHAQRWQSCVEGHGSLVQQPLPIRKPLLPQRLTQALDCSVQVALELYDRVRPQALLNLFPGDQFAGVLEQHHKHLEWLLLELDLNALPAQFS